MADETALLHVEGDDSGGMDMLAGLDEMVTTLQDSLQGLADAMNSLSGLDEIFTGLAATLGEVNAQVDALDSAIGDLASVTSSAASDLDAVGASAQQVTSYEDDLAASISQVESALSGQAASAQEIAAAQDELASSVQQAASVMTEEADSAAASAASLQENAAASQEAASAAQENAAAQTEAKDAADAGTSTFSKAAMGMGMVGIAVGMAAKSFLDMGMQAQDSMSILQGLTGASAADMRTYTSGLEQMSTDLGVTLTQAANGMYYVASSGYTGAAGLNVLKYAMEAAKAGGADMMVVASALTSSMRAYGASADQAGQYSDMLISAVTQGKQSFQDLAASIGPAAVTGKEAGFSFQQVASAEALMTQSGFDAHRAVMDLDFLMRAVGINAANVATQAHKMGLEFNLTTFQSLDLEGRLQYLNSITHGSADAFVHFIQNSPHETIAQLIVQAKSLGVQFDASKYATMSAADKLQYLAQISANAGGEFEKLVGGANGLMAASILTQNAGKNYAQMMQAISHSTGATASAFAVSERTISSAGQHIQASLSVLAFQVIQAITPVIAPILTNISNAIGYLASHAQIATPILAALGTLVGGTLIVGLGALAVALIGPIAPILAIVAAIAVLVGGIVLLVQHWHEVTSALSRFADTGPMRQFFSVLQSVGSFLASAFRPIWQDLVDLWTGEVVPAWGQLRAAVAPLLPVLKTLGQIIGAVVIVAIAGLVGTLGGLIRAFASVVGTIVRVVGDIIQIFTGLVQVLSGIMRLIYDVFTGNWGHIAADINQILHGILNIVSGVFMAIVHIISGALGAVKEYVVGFVETIIGFFQHLFDVLVGHSIVPDMINGIVQFFFSLPGRIFGMLAGFVASAIAFFANLSLQAIQKASSLVSGVVNWMAQLPGRALSAISSMSGRVLGFLGNLAGQCLSAGANIVKNIAGGILNGIGGFLSNAMNSVASFISSHLPHSPAKVGPLRDLALQGEMISHQLAGGLLNGMPFLGDTLVQGLQDQVDKIKGTSVSIAAQVAQAGPSSAHVAGYNTANTTLSSRSNANQMIQVLMQIATLLQQQNAMHQQAQRGGVGGSPLNANLPAVNQYNTFQMGAGGASLQQLYQQLNVLAGKSNEYGLRGAPNGLS